MWPVIISSPSGPADNNHDAKCFQVTNASKDDRLRVPRGHRLGLVTFYNHGSSEGLPALPACFLDFHRVQSPGHTRVEPVSRVLISLPSSHAGFSLMVSPVIKTLTLTSADFLCVSH